MLAGPIALLKLRATRAAYKCGLYCIFQSLLSHSLACFRVCDDANQILGGRAITQSGMVIIVSFTKEVVVFERLAFVHVGPSDSKNIPSNQIQCNLRGLRGNYGRSWSSASDEVFSTEFPFVNNQMSKADWPTLRIAAHVV